MIDAGIMNDLVLIFSLQKSYENLAVSLNNLKSLQFPESFENIWNRKKKLEEIQNVTAIEYKTNLKRI